MNTDDPEIKRLLDELAALRETAKRRLELLRKCEWSSPGVYASNTKTFCPLCGGNQRHKPDCPLAAELKEPR